MMTKSSATKTTGAIPREKYWQWQHLTATFQTISTDLVNYRTVKYLERWYILCVNWPSIYLPLNNGDVGCMPFVSVKGSFLRTSTPSPPPVSALLAIATVYNCPIRNCNAIQKPQFTRQLDPVYLQ